MARTDGLEPFRRYVKLLFREKHAIVGTDLAVADVVEFLFYQALFDWCQVIDEKLAFDMVVFVENNAGCNSTEFCFV